MKDQGKLKFDFDSSTYKAARLAVMGVGGAGSNAVGTMIERNVENVTLVVCNTDLQALEHSKVAIQLQLGEMTTKGRGAGGNPAAGHKSAEESLTAVEELIRGVDMLFITAGMGGGTGTGAAPVIARKATDMGILTVGIVTRPFRFEGRKRDQIAQQGIEAMKDSVNTLIVIPNQKLMELEEADLTIMDAFKRADEVLVNAVRGISDLITTAGYVNVDFADVQAIMENSGMAIMSTGEASGEDRALEAAKKAIASPLLDSLNIAGAKGVLVNITGPTNMSMGELDKAVGYIQDSADPNATFIFGYVLDETMKDAIKVTVIATGLDQSDHAEQDERIRRRRSFQENLDVPAWVRQGREREAVRPGMEAPREPPARETVPREKKVISIPYTRTSLIEADMIEEQIEIPSFRRREMQAKKGQS
ncbi:MAG: cell division protein FtsZ [Myxococcales bacterium]|nr:MAG: cell division protein FtsZ [Myxococcales bacterium]